MLQPTAKGHYAVLAAVELGVRFELPQPTPLRDIAQQHAIPQPFLTQILQQMKMAGLVVSIRGASGGYRLSRSPELISVWDVLQAVCPELGDFTASNLTDASSSANRLLQQLWRDEARGFTERLSQVAISDLVEQLEPAASDMFYI
jgi:Rrf2 family transcriptional regulator, cysteine metabolism repressor